MRYQVLIILLMLSLECLSQVRFIEDPQVSSIMNLYTEEGKSEEFVDGWRIKVISTTDYRELDRVEYTFRQLDLGLTYKSEYENPYYSLKVGAFESRFELEPVLVQLKENFQDALPFRDRILKSDLFN